MSQAITDHKFDVTNILSFDEYTGYLYYLATNNDPRERQLYRLVRYWFTLICLVEYYDYSLFRRKNIFSKEISFECITCNMNLEDTGTCLYNSPSFSPNTDYYILDCLGDKIPMTYVKSIKNKTYERKWKIFNCMSLLIHLIFKVCSPRLVLK